MMASDTQSQSYLKAVFTVEPHSDVGCAILASGQRGTDVSHTLVAPADADCDTQCRSELTVVESGKTQFVSGAVTDRCICPVFRWHDCIASIERFEGETLEISVTVPDRSALETIVCELREIGATIRLQRISAPTGTHDDQPLELEVSGITDKQREAVLVAVEEGYYETPRRTDLGELADTLGISKSAVSQRLSAVESNLVTSLFERESGGEDGR